MGSKKNYSMFEGSLARLKGTDKQPLQVGHASKKNTSFVGLKIQYCFCERSLARLKGTNKQMPQVGRWQS